MNKIKIAVIGYGSIGKRHVSVIENEERAYLTGICDIDKKKLDTYQNENNCLLSSDYENFLKNVDADTISICTPHDLHAFMAVDCLKRGFHVIVEKPMCLGVDEGLKMIQVAEENNRKLFVIKQNRYNIPVQLANEAIRENKLGEIYMVKCDVLWNRFDEYYTKSDWRGKIKREGGALYTQGSHFVDLLVWWFGDIVEAKTMFETKRHKIETDDCGSSIIKFSSGTMGSINWTTNVYNKNYEGSITVIGEKGTIKIGGQYLNEIEYWDVQSFPLKEGIVFNDKPNMYNAYQGSSSNHYLAFRNIISNLYKEQNQVVDGRESLKTIRAIDLIYNSR